MKKFVYFSFIVLLVLGFTTACGSKPKDVSGDSSFNKYTGVYKYKDVELHVLHFEDDKVLINAYDKDGEFVGNPGGYLEKSVLDDIDLKFEFTDKSVKVKGKSEVIPNGEFEKTGSYGDKAVYADYVGETKYFNNSFNGKFENADGQAIYIVQNQENQIRLKFTIKDKEDVSMYLEKQEDDSYTTNFFESDYKVTFDGDDLELTITTTNPENEYYLELNGTYHKQSKNTMVELINLFAE